MKTSKVIAIDGTSGAGKSTVARAISRQLGFLHVDSGALYRIITWQVLQQGVAAADEVAVAALAATLDIAMEVFEQRVVFTIDAQEPGDAIRTAEVNTAVSLVSKVPAVRARVTTLLREMCRLGPLVVEGRDIGTVVYPDSPARFYLDAAPEERARRRHLEEQSKGIAAADQAAVMTSLLRRDQIDSSRAVAPLRVAAGAQFIDTTKLSIEEVVAAIIDALPAEWVQLRKDATE